MFSSTAENRTALSSSSSPLLSALSLRYYAASSGTDAEVSLRHAKSPQAFLPGV